MRTLIYLNKPAKNDLDWTGLGVDCGGRINFCHKNHFKRYKEVEQCLIL